MMEVLRKQDYIRQRFDTNLNPKNAMGLKERRHYYDGMPPALDNNSFGGPSMQYR